MNDNTNSLLNDRLAKLRANYLKAIRWSPEFYLHPSQAWKLQEISQIENVEISELRAELQKLATEREYQELLRQARLRAAEDAHKAYTKVYEEEYDRLEASTARGRERQARRTRIFQEISDREQWAPIFSMTPGNSCDLVSKFPGFYGPRK